MTSLPSNEISTSEYLNNILFPYLILMPPEKPKPLYHNAGAADTGDIVNDIHGVDYKVIHSFTNSVLLRKMNSPIQSHLSYVPRPNLIYMTRLGLINIFTINNPTVPREQAEDSESITFII